MSGQLVGEVLRAAEAGLLKDLSGQATAALIPIAEKCHTDTRQGAVRWAYIQGWLAASGFGSSRSTVERVVAELKKSGRVCVVRRGHKAPGKPGQAPVYELLRLELPSSSTTEGPETASLTEDDGSSDPSFRHAPRTMDDGSLAASFPHGGPEVPSSQGRASLTLDGSHDGTNNDGTNNDGAAALHLRASDADSVADDLIFDTISAQHPKHIRDQLRQQAVAMIHESWDPNTEFELSQDALREALSRWDERSGVGPKMLPHIYCDVIKGWFSSRVEL